MIQDRWFELRATGPDDAVTHCLIRLNHPEAVVAARRWDLAADLATVVLGRRPTTEELKPIGSETVTEFAGFTSNLVFLKGSVLGLKSGGKPSRNVIWKWLRAPFDLSKRAARRKGRPQPVTDGFRLNHGAQP